MSLTNLDAGPFKVGDRVTGTVASLKGERATVIDRGRTWVRVQMDSRTDDVRYYLPSDLVNLSQGDAEDTFKVGDRVTRTSGVYAGVPAMAVTVYGQMVNIRSEAQGGPNGHYNRSVLKLVDVEGADTNAKTDIRVVALFSSPGTQKLEMVFYDAREADVWIDYLKNAPGVTTVTRNTTETFTRNNA